jgi:hypothetical protein
MGIDPKPPLGLANQFALANVADCARNGHIVLLPEPASVVTAHCPLLLPRLLYVVALTCPRC